MKFDDRNSDTNKNVWLSTLLNHGSLDTIYNINFRRANEAANTNTAEQVSPHRVEKPEDDDDDAS
jgi:hypothetical protein